MLLGTVWSAQDFPTLTEQDQTQSHDGLGQFKTIM